MPDLPHFARFWMICKKPQHAGMKTQPTRRYSQLPDARTDAEKLAAQTGDQFLILETVEIVHPTDLSAGFDF